jgi:integrase
MSDGERLYLVVSSDGLPVPLANQYGILVRRPHVQGETLQAELRVVAHVYDWACRRRIDLEQRLASGNSLNPDELRSLYQNLRFELHHAREAALARLSNVQELAIVQGDTHTARVHVARDFLAWGLARALYSLDVRDPQYRPIRDRLEQIERLAAQYRGSGRDDDVRSLPNKLRRRLLQIVHPNYKNNPFQQRVRYRNWLIIVLLLVFGYRRSEILKICTEDLKLWGASPTITLVRRPGDPRDPRGDEPNVKTLGRELPLTKTLARILSDFVLYHRPQFPGSEKSPFLLFSANARPLSKRQVNSVMSQIIKRFPEFRGSLFPHALRHTSNDLLLETARRSGLTDELLQQAQNYINGWQIQSEQGARYTLRTIEESARKLSLQHQEEILK